MRQPIILDMGDSYDDYFALALAAASPEIDLLGVTTARDGGGVRTRLVRTILDAYGRNDVPVAAGDGARRDAAFLTACIEEFRKSEITPAPASSLSAVEFMADVLTQRKKVTLVLTGPLTNVAALLKQHPDIEQSIEDIFFMGGWTTQALPEHNVRLDPESVAETLQHDVRITAAGYEATRGYRLLRPHSTRLKSAIAPGPRTLYTLYRTWCREKNLTSPGMLDPFIIAYLCGQVPAEFETMRVGVNLTPGPGRGTMFSDKEAGRPVRIFTKVDASRYIDFLISRVAPQPVPQIAATNPARWGIKLRAAYRLKHYPGWSLGKTLQPFHTLVLIQTGIGKAQVGQRPSGLESGTVLYVPPNVSFSVQSNAGMEAFWFYFYASYACPNNGSQPLDRLPLPYQFNPQSETDVWTAMAKRVVKYWMHHWPEAALLCKSAFLELIANVCIRAYEQEIQGWGSAQEAALQAKRWIEARVAKTITLEEIAKQVLLSKYHLIRVFSELFGVPPLQYQRDRKSVV